MYCSEASPGSDSGLSEDPGRPDSPPAPKAPSSPALYEVIYEAGALERMQGEARPAVGLISIQLDQWSPPFMVPDACMVSELPLDARVHLLPPAGAVSPVPPSTLVSLGAGRPQSSLIHTYVPTWMGAVEEKTWRTVSALISFVASGQKARETWAI